MAQNFVFEIPWTVSSGFVIMNSHMHWSMQKLGYQYILFSKKNHHPTCLIWTERGHARINQFCTSASAVSLGAEPLGKSEDMPHRRPATAERRSQGLLRLGLRAAAGPNPDLVVAAEGTVAAVLDAVVGLGSPGSACHRGCSLESRLSSRIARCAPPLRQAAAGERRLSGSCTVGLYAYSCSHTALQWVHTCEMCRKWYGWMRDGIIMAVLHRRIVMGYLQTSKIIMVWIQKTLFLNPVARLLINKGENIESQHYKREERCPPWQTAIGVTDYRVC
jgi:hypothetical protein